MSITRRNFLKLGGMTAVAAASGCSVIGREVAQRDIPDTLPIPTLSPNQSPNLPHRLLNRAAFGPRPGDLAQLQALGVADWLEAQLHPDAIDDTAATLIERGLSLSQMDMSQLLAQEPADAALELIGATMARAILSKRQLYEVMVEFWSDHFNIYLRKNKLMPLLKLADDRDVIRPHALGKFRDLLFASAHSPAMLVYLDNIHNEKGHPNENYGRELMELHTLGVNAGYTQTDVQELARILTGWRVRRRGIRAGETFLNEDAHDRGAKTLLGQTFPPGRGQPEIEAALEMLAAHPATAQFIAAKLVRRFVADEPPTALVAQVAQTFTDTDGDIKAMLRVIFLSEEFGTAPMKLKRPFTFLISTLRALNVDVRPNRPLFRWLERMGQPLFHWPAPDGYPDVSAAWAGNLLPRWNYALAVLHSNLPDLNTPLERLVQAADAQSSTEVLNLFAGLTWGRALDDEANQLFTDYAGDGRLTDRATQQRLKDAMALMLASPEFQWT